MESINPSIKNEFNALELVVLGHAQDMGGIPSLKQTYDPKSKESVQKGIYPNSEALQKEMDAFAAILKKHNVKILKPSTIPNLNQVFARDLSFVIRDTFIFPEIIPDREEEQKALRKIIGNLNLNKIVDAPEGIRIEGGDVLVYNDIVFVGYSNEDDFKQYKTARTNAEGLMFLQSLFIDHRIIGLELVKSDDDPYIGTLHLDCCFQPLGLGHCLIAESGFKRQADYNSLIDYFGKSNCIVLNAEEKYMLGCNVFSINAYTLVSDIRFERINALLRQKGYTVEEVQYEEVSKMGGLLRCTTLPLIRK